MAYQTVRQRRIDVSDGSEEQKFPASYPGFTGRPVPWQTRLLPAITGIAGLIIGGVLVGVTGSRSADRSQARSSSLHPSQPATNSAPTTVHPTSASALVSTPASTVIQTVSRTVTATPQPLAQLGDGTFLVPMQVRPGTWSTNGMSQISSSLLGCYWARLRSLSGELDSVIASDNIALGAPTAITVAPTDKAVKFTGGCQWRRIA